MPAKLLKEATSNGASRSQAADLTRVHADPQPSTSSSVKAEARRRARFIRGMGGSECGYCDGYADGFEHAIAWLSGKLSDPLSADYSPSSGMAHPKEYYASRPKDRSRILEWFQQLKD